MRPSALGSIEIAVWHKIISENPSLQRAFLTHSFALACERATGRAYVAVVYDAFGICGFLPFQFRSIWHEKIRYADRIGGDMSDASGFVAFPDVRISSSDLVRIAGLGSMRLTHLMPEQEQFGLDGEWQQTSYVTDLNSGPDAYFSALLERDRGLVRDTERCQRKAEQTFGTVHYENHLPASFEMVTDLIEAKRSQYIRTQSSDPFVSPEPMRLLAAINESSSPDCRLVLSRLKARGRVLAQHLGIRYGDVLSYWFPVYDQDAKNVSPGRLMLWQIIRHATEEGVRLIDYGQGDADYKLKFSTGSMRVGRASWSAGTVLSCVARAWQSVEWRVQRD